MAIRSSLKLLTAAVMGCAAAGTANAQLVEQWEADVTTEWVTEGDGAPTFNDDPQGTFSVSPSLITWGGTGSHTVIGQDPAIARSALEIQNSTVTDVTVITNGPFVDTSNFFHYNNTLAQPLIDLETASVLTTLNLTPLVPPTDGEESFQTTFLVNFIETDNVAPCFEGSESVCDDVFVVTLGELITPFTFNGVSYEVEIRGDLQPLSAAACEAAGVAAGCVGLVTQEEQITNAQFAFAVRAIAQVPEPGVLALLGLGLAGVGVATRRKSA